MPSFIIAQVLTGKVNILHIWLTSCEHVVFLQTVYNNRKNSPELTVGSFSIRRQASPKRSWGLWKVCLKAPTKPSIPSWVTQHHASSTKTEVPTKSSNQRSRPNFKSKMSFEALFAVVVYPFSEDLIIAWKRVTETHWTIFIHNIPHTVKDTNCVWIHLWSQSSLCALVSNISSHIINKDHSGKSRVIRALSRNWWTSVTVNQTILVLNTQIYRGVILSTGFKNYRNVWKLVGVCSAHTRHQPMQLPNLQQPEWCKQVKWFIDIWSDEHICQQSAATHKNTGFYNPHTNHFVSS